MIAAKENSAREKHAWITGCFAKRAYWFDKQIRQRGQRDQGAFEESMAAIAGTVLGWLLSAAQGNDRRRIGDATDDSEILLSQKPEVPEVLAYRSSSSLAQSGGRLPSGVNRFARDSTQPSSERQGVASQRFCDRCLTLRPRRAARFIATAWI